MIIGKNWLEKDVIDGNMLWLIKSKFKLLRQYLVRSKALSALKDKWLCKRCEVEMHTVPLHFSLYWFMKDKRYFLEISAEEHEILKKCNYIHAIADRYGTISVIKCL